MEQDIGFEEQIEQEELAKQKQEIKVLGPKTKIDPDGTEYEWDPDKKAWFPKIDADFIANYQLNYGITENPTTEDTKASSDTGQSSGYSYEDYCNNYFYNQQTEGVQDEHGQVKGDNSGSDPTEDQKEYTEEEWHEYYTYYYGSDYKKYFEDYYKQLGESSIPGEGQGEGQNKGNDDNDKKAVKGKRKFVPQKRDEGWFNVEDAHNTNVYVSGMPFDITDEEFKELMSKYGLIMYDPRTRKPKIKLYKDENGDPKGDGRCCFIKKESVDLALQILDGSDYNGHKIKVERASFQLKGEFDPSKKKKKLSNKEKNKFKEKQEKLFDWRPDRPKFARFKYEKVVVFKNMFDPKDFEVDPSLINSIRNDLRAQCVKHGDVKKIVVYDRHTDGIITVMFKEAEEADQCIDQMNRRYFAKRRILAATWDGKAKYDVEETEEEREKRLKKWEEFLESGKEASDSSESSDKKTESSAETQSVKMETESSENINSADKQVSVCETVTQSEIKESADNQSITGSESQSNHKETQS